MGVEILAGSYSVDRGVLEHNSIMEVYRYKPSETFELIVDSFRLYRARLQPLERENNTDSLPSFQGFVVNSNAEKYIQ